MPTDDSRARQIHNICTILELNWKRYPSLRLGQFLNNAIGNEHNLFYITDASMVRHLTEYGQTEDEKITQ